MNGAQLQAFFAEHKTAVLGTAAAAVTGLALVQRKKAGTGVATTAGATVPGTIPAAAVIPAGGSVGGGGYDSTSYDLYNALQPEISQILQQQQNQQTGGTAGGGTTAAPAPIASTLYAPTGGKLISYSNGLYEMETDGSLYHISPSEWASIIKSNGGKKPAATQLSGNAPTSYGGSGNLQNFIKRANPNKATPIYNAV